MAHSSISLLVLAVPLCVRPSVHGRTYLEHGEAVVAVDLVPRGVPVRGLRRESRERRGESRKGRGESRRESGGAVRSK